MSELRFDPLDRTWTIIAPERRARPSLFEPLPRIDHDFACPFCLVFAGEADATRISAREVGDDAVWAVANRFPALRVEASHERAAAGPYDWASGVGAHEVILETRRHDPTFADLSDGQITAVVATWRDRVTDLLKDRRLFHASVFRNGGLQAGGSIHHPHSQILATPVRPPRLERALASAKAHHADKTRCLICDIVRHEMSGSSRVVAVSERFVAFCPYASRHPFEVCVAPRDHVADFRRTSDEDAHDLGVMLKQLFSALGQATAGADTTLILHTAPSTETVAYGNRGLEAVADFWHWRVELYPRLRYLAGFELATDMTINAVVPEHAAAHLRTLI